MNRNEKLTLIIQFIEQHPDLSNRAIAKLADVSPLTVATTKIRMELPHGERHEASGRRARGVRPALISEPLREILPTVYRCYGKSPGGQAKPPLLYIGSSLRAILRLATHEANAPWYHEIVTIRLTHYSTERLARAAEAKAIYQENPKYNQRQPALAQLAPPPIRKRRLNRHSKPN